MGKQYEAPLEAKLKELCDGRVLRTYVNDAGVEPAYHEHVDRIFERFGVQVVTARRDADLVFDGHDVRLPLPGQVVAFFADGQLLFAGELKSDATGPVTAGSLQQAS